MKFTFGIITNGEFAPGNRQRINKIIRSIKQEQIPKKDYEIIVVGDYSSIDKKVCCIKFDENEKQNWITKKKNIIAQKARFENIVFLHDYITLVRGWYQGWLKFGNDWDVGMNVIQNYDGGRFRDWIAFDDIEHPTNPRVLYWHQNFPEDPTRPTSPYLPDYTYNHTQYMYVSGSYWVAKKEFMLKNPLDERLCWGKPEDIEWSMRVRNAWSYKMNTFSSVKFLKQKDSVWRPLNPAHMSHEYITKDLVQIKDNKTMENKVIFVNIDGVIIQHEESQREQLPDKPKLISPSINKLVEWNKKEHQIILTTQRKERYRRKTEQQLEALGIPYDILIMGLRQGEQIIINNTKNKSEIDTCCAFSPKYNQGLDGIEL